MLESRKTIWSDELGESRDIRIAVSELLLIAEQLRDSGREDLDFLHDMLMAAAEGEEDELHDFTA